MALKPTDVVRQWQLQVSNTRVCLPWADGLARPLGGRLQAGPGSVFAVTFTVNNSAPLQIVE